MVSCAIFTIGFIDDPSGLHRGRAVPDTVRSVRGVSVGDAGWRIGFQVLARGARSDPRHRCAGFGARQLSLFRPFFRRAARFDLRAGDYKVMQSQTGRTDRKIEDASWFTGGALLRLLGVLDFDGEEARVVGGAVRNALLGMPTAEIDIATTAVPTEVVKRVTAVGFKPVPTGIEHGTVTVVVDKHPFEVTTL